MRMVILLALTVSLRAATITVCTSGCSHPATPAGLQAALAAAQCGDTVQIEAGVEIRSTGDGTAPTYTAASRSCAAGNEILVTTSKPDWLPNPDQKILPGYRSLIPTLTLAGRTSGGNEPFLTVRETTAGIKFVGIGFTIATQSGPFNLIRLGAETPVGLSSLANRIVFDRILVRGDFTETQRGVANLFLGNTKDFRLLNSFVRDLYYPQNGPYVEGHLYTTQNADGPQVFRNNFLSTGMGEALLYGGGSGPNFSNPQLTANNVLVEHNSFYHPTKWVKGDPNYVGDNNLPCMKNFMEFKQGTDSIIRWNTGENLFTNCGSQYSAVTMTIRNEGNTNGLLGSLDASRRIFTLPGYPRGNPLVGSMLGIALNANPGLHDGYEWHTVTQLGTCNQNTCVFTVDQPYSGNLHTCGSGACTNLKSAFLVAPWWSISRVQIYGNLWKNTLSGLNYLGIDDTHLGGANNDLMMYDNIIVNNSPLMSINSYGLGGSSILIARLSNQGRRPTIRNNTYWIGPNTHAQAASPNGSLNIEQNDISGNITHDLKFDNNIGPGGGLFGSATGGQELINNYTDGSTEALNNDYSGSSGITNLPQYCGAPSQCHEPCRPPRKCSGSILGPLHRPYLADPLKNDFRVKPMQTAVCRAANGAPIHVTTCAPHGLAEDDMVRISGVTTNTAANGVFRIRNVTATTFDLWNHLALDPIAGNGLYAAGNPQGDGATVSNPRYRGGSDGNDMGAAADKVAAIRYLKATPGPNQILFSWNLPSVLLDQACQIEVSRNQELITETGEYTLVNALRPDFFKRADSDRSNPRAVRSQDGAWRNLLVGEAVSEVGDDGQSHNLALSPDTSYYYRLMCGGAFEQGSVKTLASSAHSGTVNFAVRVKAAVGNKVRVRYGSRISALTTGSPVPCAGGCNVTIPAQAGTQLIYYLDELDEADRVVFRAANPTVVPVF